MKKNNFYVTTPIYYPSGNLHIGHAYTTTLADILARYKKEMGYNVFFLTGSDEHGLKIQQKAEAQGVEPKVFVDGIVETFKNLWKLLDIDYDRFIRTTDQDHVDAVQKIFTDLYEKDLIYPSSYQGKYCVSCEEFLTRAQYDDDFKHNVCGNVAIDFEEETYMLKVSAFKDFLVKLFATDFLIPEARKNEMLNNFILNNLEDLSVTRVSFDWGIKIKENDGSLSVNADLNSEIMLSAKKTIKNYQAKMDKYNISEAVMEVLKLGQECNKLIEDTRPWDLEKEGKIKELELFLANIRQAIIVICYLLKPVLVKNYTRMVTQMGANANKIKFENLLSDEIDFAKIVTKEIIFERLK
jgi:methionyl-tRNA synthetase